MDTTANDRDQVDEDTSDEQLRALRLRHEELVAAREAKQAAADTAAELAAAKQAVIDEQALSEAIDQHGAVNRFIGVVETDLGLVILKRASSGRYNRFQELNKYTHDELYKLVSPTLVHPSRERFSAMLEEQPAILVRAANTIARLAGMRGEELAKK